MPKASEEISKYNANSGGKTDSNLANDSLHLNGIPAEQYATKKYVQDYHGTKEAMQKEYIDEQNKSKLEQAKAYTDQVVEGQDFSNFAKVTDVQAVDTKLINKINDDIANQKAYTDNKTQAIINDVNNNFDDVHNSISKLNSNQNELFQSVSSGKSKVAGAITDKGVATSANDTFDTMASNIRNIQSGGGSTDPNYVNTADATATADKIASGYTAYVQGQKLYGTLGQGGDATPYDILKGKKAWVNNKMIEGILSIDETSGKPSYDTNSVEKIYGTDYNNLTIKNINADLFGVKAFVYHEVYSKPIYLLYFDNTNKNLEIYGLYNGEIDKKIQTITYNSLGITAYNNSTSNLYVQSVVCTSIDYEHSYIAVCATSTSASKYMRLNLIHMKAGLYEDGYNLLDFEIDKIQIRDISNSTMLDKDDNQLFLMTSGTMALSSDCKLLSISTQCENKGYSSNRFYGAYIIFPATLSTIEIQNSIQSTGYNVDKSYFIMNNRAVIHAGRLTTRIIMFKNVDGTPMVSNYATLSNCVAISNDGTFMITHNDNKTNCKLYYTKITINPDEGTVTTTSSTELNIELKNSEIEDLPTGIIYANDKAMTMVTRYVPDNNISIEEGKYINIYQIENEKITEVSNELIKHHCQDATQISTVSQDKKFILWEGSSLAFLASSGINYNEVIALRYNGEYFYKKYTEILTAGQGDVRTGKTFIGWMGYPETGTMEVSE